MVVRIEKEYLEKQYKQAVLELKCAHSEEEQWQARKVMAGLERTAMEEFGFEYADGLHDLMIGG